MSSRAAKESRLFTNDIYCMQFFYELELLLELNQEHFQLLYYMINEISTKKDGFC